MLSKLHAITWRDHHTEPGIDPITPGPKAGVTQPMTDEKREGIRIMIRNGYTNDEIAEFTGFSPTTISKYRTKMREEEQ